MKKILVAAFVLIGSMAAMASETGSKSESNSPAVYKLEMPVFKGRIVDQSTNDGLAGVEVKIYGSDMKTYTDFEGNFEFSDLTFGAQALIINYISYEQKVQNVLVSAEKENKVEIYLSPKD